MKIVVVGGVAAGASVAARARRLDEGAEIVVLERGHHVSFANCGLPYHIGEVITDRQAAASDPREPARVAQHRCADRQRGDLDRPERKRSRSASSLRAASTPRPTTLSRCAPAPKRSDRRFPESICPGIHVLRRISDMDAIKAELDAALALRPAGDRGAVRCVVDRGRLHRPRDGREPRAPRRNGGRRGDGRPDLAAARPRDLGSGRTSPSQPGHRGSTSRPLPPPSRARGGGLTVELTNSTSLRADLVILSAGVRPASHLAQDAGLELGDPRRASTVDTHMRTTDPHIWAAGDSVETPNTVLPGSWLAPLAGPANREARVAAENICGRDTEYTSTQGTSIVKVFDMVAGGTGATERQLTAAGFDYRAVHVHPSGHAGYYPGTAMMHMKVLFAPEHGRILGAQIAGFDGVDKRLDVFATALRAELTVWDLEELELAYAPPFGSAKDPVNMAGFVASNVLLGDLALWYAQDYPHAIDGARIIDVRTPEEFSIWHLPGAENVPLATIRTVSDVGQERAAAALLLRRVPQLPRLPILVQRGLHRCRHPLRRLGDLPRVARTGAGRRRAEACRDGLRRGRSRGWRVEPHRPRHARKRRFSRPRLLGAGVPGPDHEARRDDDDASTPATTSWSTSPTPGSPSTRPAWAKRNGHQLLDLTPDGPGYVATMRKGGPAPAAGTGRRSRLPDRSEALVRGFSTATSTSSSPRSSSPTVLSRWAKRCRCSSRSGG